MVRTKQTARKSTSHNFKRNGNTSSSNKLTSFLQTLQTARKSTTKSVAKKSGTSDNLSKLLKSKVIKIDGAVKPPGHRKLQGAKALKEIRHYQSTTSLLVKRLPFQRLVREICQGYKDNIRFQVSALEGLQVAFRLFPIFAVLLNIFDIIFSGCS